MAVGFPGFSVVVYSRSRKACAVSTLGGVDGFEFESCSAMESLDVNITSHGTFTRCIFEWHVCNCSNLLM